MSEKRFGPEDLRNKALLALEEAVQETRYRPVRRTLALRFALAYLWASCSGGRRYFDEFWQALGSTDYHRFGMADAALGWIYREVGVKRDDDLTMRMWKRAQEQFCPRDSQGMLLRVEPPSP